MLKEGLKHHTLRWTIESLKIIDIIKEKNPDNKIVIYYWDTFKKCGIYDGFLSLFASLYLKLEKFTNNFKEVLKII